VGTLRGVAAVNVTALLAHPDDELMCAGTLARYGGTVATLFVDERWSEWRASCAALGCEPLDLQDHLTDAREDAFMWNRLTVRTIEPLLPATDLWITHRPNDANTSHGHLARLAQTLARKNQASVYEIDQSLPGGIAPGAPNLYVNITDQQDAKHRAIQARRLSIGIASTAGRSAPPQRKASPSTRR
jgi:LmbE family N-acetylglucosaminyl deacetylase